jgi:hypothetical protein
MVITITDFWIFFCGKITFNTVSLYRHGDLFVFLRMRTPEKYGLNKPQRRIDTRRVASRRVGRVRRRRSVGIGRRKKEEGRR